MADDEADLIDLLIAGGVLAAVGVGLYLVVKAFDSFSEGETVTSGELAAAPVAVAPLVCEENVCPECGRRNPRRCSNCGKAVCCVAWCMHCGVGSCCTYGFMSRYGEGECIEDYEDSPD